MGIRSKGYKTDTSRDVYKWLEKSEWFKNWQSYKDVWFSMRPEVLAKMISNGIVEVNGFRITKCYENTKALLLFCWWGHNFTQDYKRDIG